MQKIMLYARTHANRLVGGKHKRSSDLIGSGFIAQITFNRIVSSCNAIPDKYSRLNSVRYGASSARPSLQ